MEYELSRADAADFTVPCRLKCSESCLFHRRVGMFKRTVFKRIQGRIVLLRRCASCNLSSCFWSDREAA